MKKMMKFFLTFCAIVLTLSACNEPSNLPTVTLAPGFSSIIPANTPTRIVIHTETTTPKIASISTSTFVPSINVPEALVVGWNTLDRGSYTLRVPPSFYIQESDPLVYLADTKTTYERWLQNDGSINNGLLIA